MLHPKKVNLLSLIKSATLVDLSVLTGENQPSSPPEGQRLGQYMMNHYTWPRGKFWNMSKFTTIILVLISTLLVT